MNTRLLCLALFFVCLCAPAANAQRVIPIIFDTDMGPDYDDVGAIALLHAFADSGKCRILATMASNRYEGVAAVLNVFNTYFHRPGIPIGVAGPGAPSIRDNQHWTDSILANYPHAIRHNADAEDAVKLYRRILATQPDNSVTIVTVGFFSNLAGLLASQPDKAAPVDGFQLVKRKVKLLVSMAGAFPRGREFNVYTDARASQAVSSDWPTPVIFSGFEIGKAIKCGLPLIRDAAIQHSPVKDVFRISMPQAAEDAQGRMSWDETAVLAAIAGPAPWWRLQYGKLTVDAQGGDSWEDRGGVQDANSRKDPGGVHEGYNRENQIGKQESHLIEAMPPAKVRAVIDRLMMHQPKN